jgi:hypothetical protein
MDPRTQQQMEMLARVRRVLPVTATGNPPATRGPYLDERVLQPFWRGVGRAEGLMVLVSVDEHPDGHEWLHVSFSRQDRVPTYHDVAWVRKAFFRSEAVVVQVFPPEAEHVNIHPYTLHLWQRLGGERLIPDLRLEGSI